MDEKYLDFKENFFNELKEQADIRNQTITLSEGKSHKNNYEVQSISVKFDNSNIGLLIYPEHIYVDYKNSSKNMVQFVNDKLDELIKHYHDRPDIDIHNISRSDIEEHIKYKVLNYGMNQELCKDMVHQKFNDLVLLPIFETKGIDGSSMNFYVNRDVQHEWNLSDGELLLIAEKNTFDVKNLNFRTMAEVLSESMGVPIELIGDTSPGMNIYVLSNMDNRFGSTAIASKQFQHEIHEKLQSNYFIIGSSIHECLIIPEDTIDDPADLAYMAKSINDDSSVMSKEEILSNSIYYYDGTKVSIANTKQELLELKSEQKVLDVSIDRHI